MKNILIKTSNNEQFGLFIEKQFCKINSIKFNTKRKKFLRISRKSELDLQKDIKHINKLINCKFIKHIGNKNNKTDFTTENKKLYHLKHVKQLIKFAHK